MCHIGFKKKENHLKLLLTFPIANSLVCNRVRNCLTVGVVKQVGTCVNGLRELPAYSFSLPRIQIPAQCGMEYAL